MDLTRPTTPATAARAVLPRLRRALVGLTAAVGTLVPTAALAQPLPSPTDSLAPEVLCDHELGQCPGQDPEPESCESEGTCEVVPGDDEDEEPATVPLPVDPPVLATPDFTG